MVGDVQDVVLPDVGSVLIAGPPMTGKYRLFVSLLSRHCERVVLISTHSGADDIRADFRDASPDGFAERIGVVDCVQRSDANEELVRHVSTLNLTEIGVEFTELAETFRSSSVDGRTGIGLHSASQLLMFSDVDTVCRFLRVLAGRVESSEWFGLVVLDDSTIGDEQVQTVENLFDGVVETRADDDGSQQYRAKGLPSMPSEWTRLST